METHRVSVGFDVLTRLNFEDELLVAFFDAFKENGIKLVSEPKFTMYGGQQWVDFVFDKGISGQYVYICEDGLNSLLVKFTKTGNSVSENDFAKATFSFIQKTADIPSSGGRVSFGGFKIIRGNEEPWAELKAQKPPHRSYM